MYIDIMYICYIYIYGAFSLSYYHYWRTRLDHKLQMLQLLAQPHRHLLEVSQRPRLAGMLHVLSQLA